MFEMSEEVTQLQRDILALIINDTHRPAAITAMLKGKHVECDQNAVIQALNDLEKRGLVERSSGKAWSAREAAQNHLD